LALFESGAILIYLAEKSGQLMPREPAARYQSLQWLMFQMSAVGPMFGQVGFFHKFAGKDYEDKRPLQRYVGESQRLLGVLDQRLSHNQWLLGDEYSIVDISTFPWIANLTGFYNAGDLVGITGFPHVMRALQAFSMRPAVQRGNTIPRR
jgi:GST-like protein